MTAPHPRAVGSYGADLVAFVEQRNGRPWRWWQRLVAARLLEHDAAGALVWLWLLLTTSRQVGKTWWLRGLCEWRLEQAGRFGEPQDIVHTAKDLPVTREAQRRTKAWARGHKVEGWSVREQNGQDEVQAPDGSRWLLRSRDAVYSYGASLAVVDEAWKVAAGVVDDGLEPTMVEREQSQGVLASTAHRRATRLFPDRRADAIAELAAPADTLLVEWSAPPGAAIDDRTGWRAASPHWSARRERLLESKLRRAQRGEVDKDDPDEDDPVESFRSQWLNVWPARRVARVERDEPLLEDEDAWGRLADLGAAPPDGLVLGFEDWFGQGCAVAAAGVLGDGRVLVWGRTFGRRAAGLGWLEVLAAAHPASRLLVGASLDGDEQVAGLGLEVESRGSAQTRVMLPRLRELVAEGGLVHDGGVDLAGQVAGCRVTRGEGGLGISGRSGRADLVKAAGWCVVDVLRSPVVAPVEWFAF